MTSDNAQAAVRIGELIDDPTKAVSYTHLRAHETVLDLLLVIMELVM